MSYLDDAGLAHFWSKIKAALSIKQDELTGVPGQVVGFGEDGRAQAVLGQVSRNLLDNADFRKPVNRNGKTRYTESGYTIDRWKIVNGELSLDADGAVSLLRNTDTEAPRNCFLQLIDAPAMYTGKTLTFSVLCKDLQGYLKATVYANKEGVTANGPSISSDGLASVTFTMAEGVAPTEFRVHWLLSPGGSCVPIAAKLELGERQTLARQTQDGWELIDPPDYDLQYALCSQYSPITGEWVGSQHSNQNMLDNWYFLDPINQRGKTEYRSDGHTIDRWLYWISSGSGVYTIKPIDSGVQITPGEPTASNIFGQRVEGLSKLRGKTLTFSMLTSTNELASTTYTIPMEGTFDSPNTFLPGKKGYLDLRANENHVKADIMEARYITHSLKESIIFVAAKLELGAVQTLAHQDESGIWILNDPPPNKALELAKCQRYYIKTRISRPLCLIYNYGGACTAWVPLKLPVAMRLNRPTVSEFTINAWISHQGKIYDTAGMDVGSAEVTVDGSCEKDGNIAFNVILNSDLTNYSPGSLGCIASISLTLNADL